MSAVVIACERGSKGNMSAAGNLHVSAALIACERGGKRTVTAAESPT